MAQMGRAIISIRYHALIDFIPRAFSSNYGPQKMGSQSDVPSVIHAEKALSSKHQRRRTSLQTEKESLFVARLHLRAFLR